MILLQAQNDQTTGQILLTRNYIVDSADKCFGLSKGDKFRVWYANNKENYKFTTLNYYDKPYAPQEILEAMLKKNPILERLINEFNLELV